MMEGSNPKSFYLLIKMEVGIIGGGFSGIISAKICLDNGFTPFLLEKVSLFGGI